MKIGTEQEWQAARKEPLGAERELEESAKRVTHQRRELPWVPVEKEYTFATDEAPQWLRGYREDVGAPDLESAVSVSAGWSVFAKRGAAVYNTYRVYPHSRIVSELSSGLLELLPKA